MPTYGLEDYIFVDDEDHVLEEFGLGSDEVAEQKCVELAQKHNKTVACYKSICIIDPKEL